MYKRGRQASELSGILESYLIQEPFGIKQGELVEQSRGGGCVLGGNPQYFYLIQGI